MPDFKTEIYKLPRPWYKQNTFLIDQLLKLEKQFKV